MKSYVRNLGNLATIAAGSLVGLAGGNLESYAQDVPKGDDTNQTEGRLEARLVEVDEKLRYDIFDRIYDAKIIGEYEKVSDRDLDGEYGPEYVKSVGESKNLRGFAIGFGEALEDAFDNPDNAIAAMSESDRELYDNFDATEALKKNEKDDNFREMIGVTSEYKFSAGKESDKLAAFVVSYVEDDMDVISSVSANFATSLLNLARNTDDKRIEYKFDVNSDRFKRVANFIDRTKTKN